MHNILIDVWLDDEPHLRECPEGFKHFDNISDIKKLLETKIIRKLSLDHDLGCCRNCNGASCEHMETGMDLLLWMIETNQWPKRKVRVHSRNKAKAKEMRQLINKFCPHRTK